MTTPASVSPPPTTYDNNNSANSAKLKQGDVEAELPPRAPRTRRPRLCTRLHLNSLWSVWYGFFGTFLQAYTAVKCAKRFLRYSVLPWGSVKAVWELHVCLGVTGMAVVMLPIFLATAVFKVGNHANDGYKLGRGHARVSTTSSSRPCGALWRHAGPTAAFLHLVIAVLLLAPRLVMEARLVQHGFLPADALWRTDLDFMVVHHDRLVVLSFMTAASPPGGSHGPNITSTLQPGGLNQTTLPAGDAMALTGFNISAPGVLEATVTRSLAQDVLDFLKSLLKMSDDDSHAIESHIEPGFGSTVSVEYINYAIALLVYSVRYPAVFWTTNKCFGIIFSIQLLINSIQSLLAFAGISVLYKVQVVGAQKALPLLRHFPKGHSLLGGDGTPFVLNSNVTLALFGLSSFLVLASSMILYLYGHARYNSFLSSYKDRAHITSLDTGPTWGYRTHGAALATLLATAVTLAPLLHDLTVVYRGSLDGAVLASIITSITTLFTWVVLWLGLTIKYRWVFKVNVVVGRATVRSARSVRLVTEVGVGREGSGQPLLVVGNGRAYAVREQQSKKRIMSVVQKTQERKTAQEEVERPVETIAQSSCPDDSSDEQIYWLRPAGASPHPSPDSVSGGPLCWRGRSHSTHSTSSTATSKKKHKVTFNESTSTSQRPGKGLETAAGGGGRVPGVDEDDGDYATLRELPLLPGVHSVLIEDDEGKLLACVHDDSVTYARTSRDLVPGEVPSPPAPVVTVHTATPRCLRRADSGMPPEELTPRSDSVSTESSSSPPSHHSESSSGVHSTASSEPQGAARRATSVADLQQPPPPPPDLWKSCSLQRNTQPPPGERGIPAVALESDTTVVIRRKVPQPVLDPQQIPVIREEPFSRSTNMKMTSFTEQSAVASEAVLVQAASSATLPHYPTQPVQMLASYPHCSTMPHTSSAVDSVAVAATTSCHVYPRRPQHSTIPTHHNGVRLFSQNSQEIVKRVVQTANNVERVYHYHY